MLESWKGVLFECVWGSKSLSCLHRNSCPRWKRGIGWLKGETLYGITRVSKWEKSHNMEKWLQYYSEFSGWFYEFPVIWNPCYTGRRVYLDSLFAIAGRKRHTAWHCQSLSNSLLFSILVISGDFMQLHAHVFPCLNTHTHTQYDAPKKRTTPDSIHPTALSGVRV